MLYFQFLVVAAVFGAIAWVAAGRGGGLDDPRRDRPEPALADDRQLSRGDVDGARFALAFRGYRMDQVDRLLDRLAAEIDHRDRLIADLSRTPAPARLGEGVGYEPVEPPTGVATAEPGFGPGVGPAPDPEAAEQQAGEANPLSAWYRPTDQEQ